MKNKIEKLWKIVKKATGSKQRKLFIEFCRTLIDLKEGGELTEEEASYRMVAGIYFENITQSPECDAILDAAGVTEIPRDTSYGASGGEWTEDIANKLKEKQWSAVVEAVERAEEHIF